MVQPMAQVGMGLSVLEGRGVVGATRVPHREVGYFVRGIVGNLHGYRIQALLIKVMLRRWRIL